MVGYLAEHLERLGLIILGGDDDLLEAEQLLEGINTREDIP